MLIIPKESRARRKCHIYYTKKLKKILSENIRENDDKKNMIKRFLGKRKISRLEFWIEIYHGCTSGLCRSENVGRRQHRIRNAFSAYDLRPTSHKFRITRGPTFFKKFLRIFVERQGFYISLTFLSVCCPFSRVTKSKRAHVTVRIAR